MSVVQSIQLVQLVQLNQTCNVPVGLGLNFKTNIVTCQDCPSCSTCSSCLTCSTCLTWMNFLSVEQGCPHNGLKTENFFKFRFWPDNFANWTIWKLWKKNFFWSKNFWSKNFLSLEPWPHKGRWSRRSSNFTFNVITFRIGPFGSVWAKKIFSENFLGHP